MSKERAAAEPGQDRGGEARLVHLPAGGACRTRHGGRRPMKEEAMKKWIRLAAGIALGSGLLVGCEKKTVTTTETAKTPESPAYASTPEVTPPPVETAATPTPSRP
jgi:hypothetical protein